MIELGHGNEALAWARRGIDETRNPQNLGADKFLPPQALSCRHIERLLVGPSREFHVLDLGAVERGSLPTALHGADPGSHRGHRRRHRHE